MFERYTEKARRTIFFARYEASMVGSRYIEPEHFLLGLLRDSRELLLLLLPPGVDLEKVEQEVRDQLPRGEEVPTSVDLPLARIMKKILAHAADDAMALEHRHIGPEHLLLGLLKESDPVAAKVLQKHGVDYEALRQEILRNPPAPPSREGRALRFPLDRIPRGMGMGGGSSGTSFTTPGDKLQHVHHFGTRWEGETAVTETIHAHGPCQITLTERFTLSDDGKTLHYSIEIRGPKQSEQHSIDFDLS